MGKCSYLPHSKSECVSPNPTIFPTGKKQTSAGVQVWGGSSSTGYKQAAQAKKSAKPALKSRSKPTTAPGKRSR